jgi:predicted DNA-binding transcriptional regulator AlpA
MPRQHSDAQADAQATAKKKATLKATTALPPALAAANEAHIIEAGLKPDVAQHQRARKYTRGARAPPAVRLLDKREICAITGVTFPSIWAWMRIGTFPRSRIVGGKSMWLSNEVEQWLAGLKVRPLKGDTPSPDTPEPNQN